MIPVCPKCDVPMLILSFQGIDLDTCYTCHGVWLDSGELEEILERTGGRPDESIARLRILPGHVPSGARHLCPRCDRPLEEIQYVPAEGCALTLDRCSRGHGLWFDKDELRQLLALLPAGCVSGAAVEYLDSIFGKAVQSPEQEKKQC